MQLVSEVARRSVKRRSFITDAEQKRWSQYFTEPEVARYMASLIAGPESETCRVLDPGAGTGILGFAVTEHLLGAGYQSVELVAIEPEPKVREDLAKVKKQAESRYGDRLSVSIKEADFLEMGDLRLDVEPIAPFDVVIANPPYYKMSPSDKRGGDSPNIYSRFMEVSAKLLKRGGELCYIIPRSYTSGYYFKRFRKRFHATMDLVRVHMFDSRKDAFKNDGVLQENIIVYYRKGKPSEKSVVISSSSGAGDIYTPRNLEVNHSDILRPGDPNGVLSLPITRSDLDLMKLFDALPGRLRDYGLEISTGPVVPFRARPLLAKKGDDASTYPLLWMQHVRDGIVTWPLGEGFRKGERILKDAPVELLVPNGNYVLMRRFSAKEEKKRIVAAVLLMGELPFEYLGFENHLNFIHRPGGQLEEREVFGLAGLLNSSYVDGYFRISSGNTQASATEMRSLPLPAMATIRTIGAELKNDPENLESIVWRGLNVEV